MASLPNLRIVKQTITEAIRQGLTLVLVDEPTRTRRLAICESCEKFKPKTRQCQVCSCFMDMKTRTKYDPFLSGLEAQPIKTYCPLNKW